MGLDGMRVGGGRCPPLFVGGLLLACLLLVCNWWSLSTENLELLRQIDELNEQLKISAEERDQCVTLRENVEQRYKRIEDEVGTLHVRLQQQNELKKQNGDLTESVTICKSELDSLNKLDATRSATLDTLRLEKDAVSTQLDVKREENEKLKLDLETALSDVEKLKLSINAQKEKADDLQPQLTRGFIDKSQLGPVADSAVEISVSGQRGMKYHGVPILPRDPPGVTPQAPLFSVTKLKGRAPPPNTIGQDNSANEGNAKEIQDDDNAVDANVSGVENRFAQQDGSALDDKPEGEQP